MMNTSSFAAFEAEALAAGADEALERHWSAGEVIPPHAHSFTADAVITRGEMWLTCGDDTRHLRVGDTFHLDHGTPHSERYGPDGATYWVARRNRTTPAP